MSELESTTAATATAAATPELTIIDLQNLRQIIDLAARRGAFQAAEMTAVGTVFNKLDSFLNAVSPAPAGSEPTTGTEQK